MLYVVIEVRNGYALDNTFHKGTIRVDGMFSKTGSLYSPEWFASQAEAVSYLKSKGYELPEKGEVIGGEWRTSEGRRAWIITSGSS